MAVHRAVTAETLPNGEALTIEELEVEVPSGTTSEDTGDGGVIITFGSDESSIEPLMAEHDANLVDYMDDGDIAMIVGAGLPRPSFVNSVSSNWAVSASRSRAVRPPMTTEIRRVLPRVAELARLKPDMRV